MGRRTSRECGRGQKVRRDLGGRGKVKSVAEEGRDREDILQGSGNAQGENLSQPFTHCCSCHAQESSCIFSPPFPKPLCLPRSHFKAFISSYRASRLS